MITYDLVIQHEEGWQAVVNTGDKVTVQVSSGPTAVGEILRVRFGVTSTSKGFIMEVGDIVTAAENIYVKSIFPTKKPDTVITVTIT
jgi:hypothetical protein